MITEDRAEAAVAYLRDTADEYGKLVGHEKYTEKNLSRVKSLQVLEVKEGSNAAKEAAAYASEAYGKALIDMQNATAARETMRALRDAAELTIEVWRSQYSGRKAGVV